MAHQREELLGLLDLHRSADPDERRALWRRGISILAKIGVSHPVPLEGLDPSALEESTKTALEDGLVDTLNWLSGSATALFNLMISLPRGDTKRELGRRILRTLLQCDAKTFVALATSLATASPKALATPQAQAQVALCLQLPYGQLPQIDALALALISSPEMAQQWLVVPSAGSLPQRQLAARLLERAAREAWRQHNQANSVGLRVFRSDFISIPWRRLLRDREPLTWRHVAAARGILVDLIPSFDEELESGLAQDEAPGLWMRGMTSLVASIAVRGETALQRCRELLASERVQERPYLMGTMLHGIVSAAAFEPEAAEVLVLDIASMGHLDSFESILAIQRERIRDGFAAGSAGVLHESLRYHLRSEDDGISARAGSLLKEMGLVDGSEATLQAQVSRAMRLYAQEGPAAAARATTEAVELADHLIGELQAAGDASAGERRLAYRALRELDQGLLESGALNDLLHITHVRGEDGRRYSLAEVRKKLHAWLLERESSVLVSAEIPHLSFRLARLKALIHLVDADEAKGAESDQLRQRRAEVVAVFRNRVCSDAPSRLRRMVTVTLARACDASLREDWYELSDLILGILPSIQHVDDLRVFSEASLITQLERVSDGYAELRHSASQQSFAEALERLEQFVGEFPWAGSPRVEALRAAMLDLGCALQRLRRAPSKSQLLEESGASAFAELAAACQWLAQLSSGARRRLEIADQAVAPFLGKALRTVDISASKEGDLGDELEGCLALAQEELPEAFAKLLGLALRHVAALPTEEPPKAVASRKPEDLPKRRSMAIPVQRAVAGFQILDALGDGGGGSVFVVCRYADRNEVAPPLFALKIPEYSGQHAQVLSEDEFIALFRQEAGTLLSLPAHPNLAGFVTFDMGAKPDPILVMEYIQGPHLGRLLESGDLSVGTALDLLDGVAAGLQAMHSMELGHLDIKPENIIVRSGSPVLVDFGLAGRQYRPGCATVYYGAPEILVGQGRGTAMPADVYSFSCLAFELLTGRTLIEGSSLKEFARAHLSHDGNPDRLVALSKADRSLLALTQALARGLRQDPPRRTSISKIRADLQGLRQDLEPRAWPLGN